MYPKARRRELLESDLTPERVVYDLDHHTAFALNDVAAEVWRRCDGATSLESIAASMSADRGTAVDPAVVALAVDRLEEAGLLDSPAEPRVSRRDALAKLGITAAALVPVVTALVVPTPAMAVSPDVPPPPPPGLACTYTPGRYKNAKKWVEGGWPGGYDPNALFFGTSLTWMQVLDMSSRNYLYALAQQYIAAKLNVAMNLSLTPPAEIPPSVLTAIASAEAILRAHATPTGLSRPSRTLRATLSALNELLTAYNEGRLEDTAHCDNLAAGQARPR